MNFAKADDKNKVTGVLLCRDRVAILMGGKGTDAVKALHGAGPMFAEGELEGLLANAIKDGLLGDQVVIGVDPLLEFFSTQRVTAAHGDDAAPELLIEELRSKYGGRLIAEPVRTSLSPKTHQTAIAVPKGELAESSRAFASFGDNKVRFIGTSHALYSLALSQDPMPKKWTSEIRVFLGAREGMVLFAIAGTLIARQIFEYSGQAHGPVIAAVNGMVAAVQEGLGVDQPDGIIFQVGKENGEIAKVYSEVCSIEAGVRTHIPYDQATLCMALALDGFRRRRQGVDFFKHAEKDVAADENGIAKIPLRPMIGLSAVVLGMGGYLWQAGSSLQAEIDVLQDSAEEALAIYDNDAIRMEEDLENLFKTVSVSEGFLMERVYWGDILGELPRLIPETMSVERIDGRYEFRVPEEPSEDENGELAAPETFDESSRFLALSLKVPIQSEGSEVPEVQILTQALKDSELLRSHFRKVPNADISKLEMDGSWQASLSIHMKP